MDVWILTSEYNDYDQHGEYFEDVFVSKPTVEQIMKRCGCDQQEAERIIAGGGRIRTEYHWYYLRKHSCS